MPPTCRSNTVSGTRYPARDTAAERSATAAVPVTSARPEAGFTSAPVTPGTAVKARRTRTAQAAQVIPSTGRSVRGVGTGASGMVRSSTPAHVDLPIMGRSRPMIDDGDRLDDMVRQ